MKHHELKPCSACGIEKYERDCDGHHCVFTCASCGAFVAELSMHTEL